MLSGNFGLEKESLRVDQYGFLAHTKHPFEENPNMERDFSENQTELITDVYDCVDSVYEAMESLHKKAVGVLWNLESGKEVLWPFSNPPFVKGEEDVHIADYKGALKKKRLYREYLAEKYGRKKMLFSGIHFNFSFSEEFLAAGAKAQGIPFGQAYKDQVYLDLAKKATVYGWLVVYLTAASPVMDGSFFDDEAMGQDISTGYTSVRCGELGYWNDFIPVLEYGSLKAYTDSIQSYVDEGQLKEPAELYYPVRLKPKGDNSLKKLRESGVNHIELRMLDLNPLSPCGMIKEDIHFLHLFLLYLTSLPDEDFDPAEQIAAIKNMKRAAKRGTDVQIETNWGTYIQARKAAEEFLDKMEQFYHSFRIEYINQVLAYQRRKLSHKGYAARVAEQFDCGFVEKGLALAKEYAQYWENGGK